MPKYYPINEDAAKRAQDMNSFSFKQTEIQRACDLLDIPLEEIPDYFFSEITHEKRSTGKLGGGEHVEDKHLATDLWTEIGNKCLSQAKALLDSETAPTAATVETVKGLVDTAISIDLLNLRWAEHNRYGTRFFRGPHSKDEDLASEVIKEINRQGQSESDRLFR